ncbi:MAG TPA: hypothetical protein VN456_10040 [Desulfosporosinus sp.]|nr:hypothetical protein [Desulfosporosinus sp.]
MPGRAIGIESWIEIEEYGVKVGGYISCSQVERQFVELDNMWE